jgi:Ca-activated chloride channel family protein
MKKKSYQITVGGKVDIVFEDETSELTFQYKDLKPSEMR